MVLFQNESFCCAFLILVSQFSQNHIQCMHGICGVYLRCPVWCERDLVIINESWPVEILSTLQLKSYSSESSQPLMNTTLSYGTLFINGSYLFCCSWWWLYSVFFPLRKYKEQLIFHYFHF